MSIKKRSPSPSPTVTLDVLPKKDLQRSSSEESIRVIQHAVLFPSSPHPGRVTYLRRTRESDAELIRRQQALIALQPLTFAEDLAARRKQLEIKAEKRKAEKAATTDAKAKSVPEITVIPASGKTSPSPFPASPTRMKARSNLKEKTKVTAKSTPMAASNRTQRSTQVSSQLGLPGGGRHDRSTKVSVSNTKVTST